jgi:hypothetical protein
MNLVRNTIPHPTASRHSFAWIDGFLSVDDLSSNVSAENFIPLMNILQEYAELAAKAPSTSSKTNKQPSDSQWVILPYHFLRSN